jgi:hypothetical protein
MVSKPQKGAGFLNRIRRAFGTRKVAPTLATPVKPINIKNETLADAMKRDFVFLHAKLQGQEPSKDKRFVTPQEEAEVKRILLEADESGLSADEIVRQIFHMNPQTFQQQFSAWELYLPERYLPDGRRAFNVSGGLQRFIATLKSKKTPRNIAYASDYQTHICATSDLNQPVRSLTDAFCFTLLTPQNQPIFEEGKGYTYAMSYMVVKPEFFPTGAMGPAVLNAKRLPVISFVLDAFQQDGVLEIEPTLQATLEREAPELLAYKSQDPVVLLIPYYLKDASTTQGRFLVVDPTIFPRGRNVVNMKQLKSNPVVQDAFAQQKVYFMDPKTMYEVRTSSPQLWLASFGSFNNNLYRTLTPQEKLAFCFLQYTKFQEIYSLNRNPRNANNNSAIARKTLNAVEQAKRQVFAADYERGANPYELAENFQAVDQENLRQLVRLQEEMFDTATVRTPEDVRRLLSKFDTRRGVAPPPTVVNYFGPSRVNLGLNVGRLATATRKQRVKQMLTPSNVQRERNLIVQRYKNALKMPIKTSMVPNMFRSKTARQANKRRYYNRLQNIQDELRAFNEKHGLKRSSGYGYQF